MAIQGLDAQCWIAALCVRDDGERLALGELHHSRSTGI